MMVPSPAISVPPSADQAQANADQAQANADQAQANADQAQANADQAQANADQAQPSAAVEAPPDAVGEAQPDAGDKMPLRAAQKGHLRGALRSGRRDFVAALASDQRRQLEQALAVHLHPLVRAARIIGGYAAMGSEIDPARLLDQARQAGCSIAYPAFERRGSPMLFRSGPCAEDCPWGGVQPPAQAIAVGPDLVLVPLLGIDRHGHRIGQGGGHYDRALPALRAAGATMIGIGWALQRLDADLAPDPWDVPLDGFASPEGLEMFR